MKTFMTAGTFKGFGLVMALMVLAGCSVAPTYNKPAAIVPSAYKEAPAADAQAGQWKPAQPAEQFDRGAWWSVFGDPTLNDLEHQAISANQNLQAATARLKQSRAMTQAFRASLFPTLDAGFGPTRQMPSGASQNMPQGTTASPQTLYRAQVGVSYEVDLFGRVSSIAGAAEADEQRSEALFRSVLLALQADVAQNYFTLRQLDAESDVFANAVGLREQALKLLQSRFDAGEISELDVARAKSELATARSDAMTVQRMRAASEHSLAVLLGKAPADFAMAPRPLERVSFRLPTGLPSALLERRPDIAAAERAMAMANARIGAAKAAFFPSLTLTGVAGYEAGSMGDLFKWSSRSFLLGPLAGTMLNLPIFDGGLRKGNLANARAVYEEDVAAYQQQVLTAFRDVEDSLSDLRVLETQTATQSNAVNASGRAAQVSRAQYKEGAVTYLEVIDAERTVLQTNRAAVQLHGLEAVATVNLIRALGGGWEGFDAVAGAGKSTPEHQANRQTVAVDSRK